MTRISPYNGVMTGSNSQGIQFEDLKDLIKHRFLHVYHQKTSNKDTILLDHELTFRS